MISGMVNYEVLYKVLFNGMTDAVWAMERQDYDGARAALVKAQQEAEELFISDEEAGDDGPVMPPDSRLRLLE
jgi:hypothetical protein